MQAMMPLVGRSLVPRSGGVFVVCSFGHREVIEDACRSGLPQRKLLVSISDEQAFISGAGHEALEQHLFSLCDRPPVEL